MQGWKSLKGFIGVIKNIYNYCADNASPLLPGNEEPQIQPLCIHSVKRKGSKPEISLIICTRCVINRSDVTSGRHLIKVHRCLFDRTPPGSSPPLSFSLCIDSLLLFLPSDRCAVSPCATAGQNVRLVSPLMRQTNGWWTQHLLPHNVWATLMDQPTSAGRSACQAVRDEKLHHRSYLCIIIATLEVCFVDLLLLPLIQTHIWR